MVSQCVGIHEVITNAIQSILWSKSDQHELTYICICPLHKFKPALQLTQQYTLYCHRSPQVLLERVHHSALIMHAHEMYIQSACVNCHTCRYH